MGAGGLGCRRPALVLQAAGVHSCAVPGEARARAGVGQEHVVVAGGPAGIGGGRQEFGVLCPGVRDRPRQQPDLPPRELYSPRAEIAGCLQ